MLGAEKSVDSMHPYDVLFEQLYYVMTKGRVVNEVDLDYCFLACPLNIKRKVYERGIEMMLSLLSKQDDDQKRREKFSLMIRFMDNLIFLSQLSYKKEYFPQRCESFELRVDSCLWQEIEDAYIIVPADDKNNPEKLFYVWWLYTLPQPSKLLDAFVIRKKDAEEMRKKIAAICTQFSLEMQNDGRKPDIIRSRLQTASLLPHFLGNRDSVYQLQKHKNLWLKMLREYSLAPQTA